MKYQYLFSIQIVSILLLCKMGLNAQEYHPFPTQNTVWTEYYYPGGGDFNTLYHNFALKDKDTIINGKSYQKLYFSFDTIFTEDKVCGALREEDKRIYYYSFDSLINLLTPLSPPIPVPVDTEIILYDFNLQVGDTITRDQYRLRADALVVTKIDSILNGTEYRKRYTFGDLHGHFLKREQWVEGVGCLRGLLSDLGNIPTNDWGSWLICCIQDGEVLYHNEFYSDCYHSNPNAVHLLKNETKIKVVPNPAKSSITISNPLNCEINTIEIIDLSGRTVQQWNKPGNGDTVLKLESLLPGMYLLKIETEFEIETKKLIVQ